MWSSGLAISRSLAQYFWIVCVGYAIDLALSMTSNGVVILLAMGLYAALMHLAGLHHVAAKVLSNGVSFLVNYRVRRSWF